MIAQTACNASVCDQVCAGQHSSTVPVMTDERADRRESDLTDVASGRRSIPPSLPAMGRDRMFAAGLGQRAGTAGHGEPLDAWVSRSRLAAATTSERVSLESPFARNATERPPLLAGDSTGVLDTRT